jgi:adenylate cyclase
VLTSPAWRRLADSALGRAVVLGLAVSLAVTLISRTGALAGWETRAIDLFLFFRDRIPTPAIVLVHLDDEAFREMGERQPLPRDYLATLGEFLLESGARVVAFDVQMTDPTDPEKDGALLALTQRWASARGGRVVVATIATPGKSSVSDRYTLTPPFSEALPAAFGFANAPLGADGLVRYVRPIIPAIGGGYLPSFALATLAAYDGHTRETLSTALGVSGGRIELPVLDAARQLGRSESVSLQTLAGAPWRIDFAGPPNSFAAFPATPLMQLARRHAEREADNPFRGRIVLVGATTSRTRDAYPTPVGLMHGVEIQANVVHTLLARRALQPPHWALNLGLMVIVCLAVALLSLRLRTLWVAIASVALVGALVLFSYEAYRRGYWLDLAAPVAAMILYRVGAAWLARRRLRRAFGEFVSTEVVARVLRDGARLGSGEMRNVSVLMSDVRGFTRLAEEQSPIDVAQTMNEYFTAMVRVVTVHDGMVQDFIGDGILAVYGAPADDAEHAWHAVQTAAGMQAALRQLNARWQAEGRPPLAMGVAVNTGRAFAGMLGAPEKKKYSVLGDVVNTVSRIEAQNRELGTEILLSASTMDVVHERVVGKNRGSVRVRGKTQSIELFELTGFVSGAPS